MRLRFGRYILRMTAAATLAITAGFVCRADTTVDQIIALVNDSVITRTDLLWSLALDPSSPSPAGPVSSEVIRRKLDVMIDQTLVEQEATRLPAPEITQQQVDEKRSQLVASFRSEAAFRERTEAVGLTLQRIDELLRQRILIDRFVDFRFRSFVFVTDAEIQQYYEDHIVREVRAAGQVPPALDKVRGRITTVIKEEKVNREIDTWLESARQHADVVHLAEL
jgi:hypothetical protein